MISQNLVPGGVVTTQNMSTVIRPKGNNNSLQFVKIQTPELSKKADEQIRLAKQTNTSKEKIKEVEEEWQNNLINWKSKRRQQIRQTLDNDPDDSLESSDNSGARKIKTFAEMVDQRAKSGNRLGFHLQRYFDDEEEKDESKEDELLNYKGTSHSKNTVDLDYQPNSSTSSVCEKNDSKSSISPEPSSQEETSFDEKQQSPVELHKDVTEQRNLSEEYEEEFITPVDARKQWSPCKETEQSKNRVNLDAQLNLSTSSLCETNDLKSPISFTPSPPKLFLDEEQQCPVEPIKSFLSPMKPPREDKHHTAIQPIVGKKQWPPRKEIEQSSKRDELDYQPQSSVSSGCIKNDSKSTSTPEPSSPETSLDVERQSSVETPKSATNQRKPQKDDKDRTVLSVSGKKRCSSCREELGRGAAAFVVESLSLVYHTNCFRCSLCHLNLSNGFRAVDVRVHNGALHCQNCYSKDGLNYSRV